MVTIIFEAHATSFDNENKTASGWYDVQLSELGKQQAIELGKRYQGNKIDAVFCSDLGRSLQTAAIAFGGDPLYADPNRIFVDWRLRECNYGDFTQKPSSIVDLEKPKRISTPFPNGESYEQTTSRIKSFLFDLLKFYDENKQVMVIGHRATQYGLENLIKNVPLKNAITTSWKWQPGWTYELKEHPRTP
jgi:broad specificity phosphatase PhoE